MKAIYTTLFFLLFASNYFPQDLPHWETEDEKIYREKYGYPVYDFFSDPPPSPVRGMAEWEELQGVIITWTSQLTILRQIVDYAQEEGIVYIICRDSNSVKSYLQSWSIPLYNLKVLITPFNSIWVRDYGPWTAYTNDYDTLNIIDWIYNRPARPLGESPYVDAPRAARIRENLGRLGLEAEVRTGDACEPSGWWDGRPFDRILVDAPCSGTGVIRLHPDIKLLRQPADIPAFAARQRDLLESAWRLLVPGGRLLYATCSVLKAENAVVVRAFLDGHGEAVEVTESARLFLPAQPPATGPGPGLALLTGAADTDGFYYACLEKRA